MKTAADFLDAVKAKHGLSTDYQLAKFLGWHQQRITKYRQNGESFNDDSAAQIAKALELEPIFVATCMAAQRAQSPQARQMWEAAAKKLSGVAAMITLSAAALIASPPSPSEAASMTVYYVKSFLSFLRRITGMEAASPCPGS